MFKYYITSTPSFFIDKNIIDKIFLIVEKNIKKKQYGILNIVFLDEDSIQQLNKNYRGINKATDVLSFHYYEDFSSLKNTDIAGEIVLCESFIKKQAKDYGLGEENEFYKLIIHSLLHILGYDHEKEDDYIIMKTFEDIIYKEIFEKKE